MRSSRDAANCAPAQEFPNILWKPKFHYRDLIHRSLSWVRFIQSTSSHLFSLSFVLILSSHLCLGLLNDIFLEFPPKSYMRSSLRHIGVPYTREFNYFMLHKICMTCRKDVLQDVAETSCTDPATTFTAQYSQCYTVQVIESVVRETANTPNKWRNGSR
jgi:hypothetical protein